MYPQEQGLAYISTRIQGKLLEQLNIIQYFKEAIEKWYLVIQHTKEN